MKPWEMTDGEIAREREQDITDERRAELKAEMDSRRRLRRHIRPVYSLDTRSVLEEHG